MRVPSDGWTDVDCEYAHLTIALDFPSESEMERRRLFVHTTLVKMFEGNLKNAFSHTLRLAREKFALQIYFIIKFISLWVSVPPSRRLGGRNAYEKKLTFSVQHRLSKSIPGRGFQILMSFTTPSSFAIEYLIQLKLQTARKMTWKSFR